MISYTRVALLSAALLHTDSSRREKRCPRQRAPEPPRLLYKHLVSHVLADCAGILLAIEDLPEASSLR